MLATPGRSVCPRTLPNAMRGPPVCNAAPKRWSPPAADDAWQNSRASSIEIGPWMRRRVRVTCAFAYSDSTNVASLSYTNTPGVNAHALAEHTIALMLAVTRRIPAMDRDLRAGQWPRGLLTQLEGRTLGLIGLGAIGSRVAVLAKPFGMRMLATTFGPDNGRAAALGAQHVPLEQLLRESDIVSLHLRLSADTQGYLGRDRLALMKPTAFLINTARGGLVDKQALIEAVRDKRIAGAALDVFHEEPIPAGDPLLALPDLVLTPHNGGMTREVIDNGVLRAVENVQLFLEGRLRDLVVPPPGR